MTNESKHPPRTYMVPISGGIHKSFHKNEKEIEFETIDDKTNVMTILEIQGIKCSANSFQIDLEIKQIMTLTPSNNNSLSLGNPFGNNNQKPKLSFNNNDFVRDEFNNEHVVNASKDYDRLEKISIERAKQRKMDEADDDDDDNVKLKISDQNVELNSLDIHQISEPNINLLPDLLIDDIEILT